MSSSLRQYIASTRIGWGTMRRTVGLQEGQVRVDIAYGRYFSDVPYEAKARASPGTGDEREMCMALLRGDRYLDGKISG